MWLIAYILVKLTSSISPYGHTKTRLKHRVFLTELLSVWYEVRTLFLNNSIPSFPDSF